MPLAAATVPAPESKQQRQPTPLPRRTRNTRQRKAILNAVRALGNHPTAAEVFAHVRTQGGYPHLSLATVYRALEALGAQGDVVEMRGNGAAARYDGGALPHHHVVCRACGNMRDVPALLPETVLSALCEASGYAVDPAYPVQFQGLCPACRGEAAADAAT